MEQPTAEDPETRDLHEEKEVNKYLQSRINDLIALIQLANSKAITFQSEVSFFFCHTRRDESFKFRQ